MAEHSAPNPRYAFALIFASAAIILITTGLRQSTGLFVQPIMADTGLSIAAVSFALAIGQFMWGATQPFMGALADHYGARRVVMLGAVLLALGSILTAFARSEITLLLTLGVLSAVGASAGSFSILIGSTARSIGPERRSLAAGIINAGGSLGQFVFAPVLQFVIGAWSWGTAMFTMAGAALLTIPLAGSLRNSAPEAPQQAGERPITLREQLHVARRDRSFLLLNAGFFTCGFHIAFLVTHFPGEIKNCGLPATVAANSIALIGLSNVAGSLGAGWLGQRFRMKYLLAWIYATRAAIVIAFLLMPKTALNIYIFAAALGVTWLATVPPTSGIVGKLFGVRFLGTLFGVTLVSHQVGGFLGAWLGGLAMAQLGSYQWVWLTDIALALLAAIAHLPIREAKLVAPALLAAKA
jgi:predicted MFS family arabinose efflux permease